MNLYNYHTRFQNEFQALLHDCKLEMYPLLYSVPPSANELDAFITAYPIKYISLTMGSPESRAVRISPVKIYGGEIISKIDTLDFINSSPPLNRDRRSIDIHFMHPADSSMHILASVALDHIVEQILNSLQLPPIYTYFLTNSNYTILHSNSIHNIGSQFDQIVDNREIFAAHSGFSSEYAWQSSELPYGLVLFLQKDLKPEFAELHRNLIGLLVFILLLLLTVLLIVRIMAGKLAASLQEITRVTQRVSHGDFSQTIKLQRRDELGELIMTFNQMVDRLNKSYQALEKTNIALEQSFSELTRTRAELSQKQRLALVGETLSKISHEIQNKIGGVSIWVQNLKIMAAENPTISLYTLEIEQSLDSFMQMLSNFKRFYREPSLNVTLIDAADLVSDAIWPFIKDAESRNIKLKTHIKDRIDIRADQDQMLDVLSNLIMNALYFSSDGSAIKCTVTRNDGYCKITVCDDGPGIPPGDEIQIFHPFYTTKTSGSGLGLAIASSVIKAHKGSITVHNEPGHGACFSLFLPLETNKS
ncbi:MAG: HAMP domain-containing sensor histidine kinase [candidate division KSB1 bacterium]|nr:HAMP domain-containing sensor histidine kinase [candidate division KSB1 bacterium]